MARLGVYRVHSVNRDAVTKTLPGLPLLAAALLVSACSHSQSAPTPATGSSATGSSVASTTASTPPWTNSAPTPSPTPSTALTSQWDAAMLLCTTALNLTPCGLVTTGQKDTLTCFGLCQAQIDTVVGMTLENAAVACAVSPPPEEGPRECTLAFPESAAFDVKAAQAHCNSRCESLAGDLSRHASASH